MSEFYFPTFDEFNLDDREQSLCEYFLRLQCVQRKIESEFSYVFDTWHELEEIRDAIAAEFAAMAKQTQEEQAGSHTRLLSIYTPGLGTAEVREQSALLRAESAAGSLILMLDDIMQRLRHSVVELRTRRPYPSEFTLGRLPGGAGYAATLIYASGNAYRHSKEWDGIVDTNGNVVITHAQYGTSRRTLDLIEQMLGLSVVRESRVSVAAVSLLAKTQRASPSFDHLWQTLTDIGLDFAERYCKNAHAFESVREALEYQSLVNSIELSYSNDERLFSHDPESDR